MKYFQLLAVALLVLSQTVVVQAEGSLPMAAPEEVGFDAARLDKIEPFFQARVDRGEIAGIVTLVARHGKIAHLSAVGHANAQDETPMRTDTIFRLYSMTKAIASTALMQLHEEGRFQLSDPLSKYIPEFKNLRVLRAPDSPLDETVAMEQEPTIHDAFRHTAGFTHGLGVNALDTYFVETGIFRPETSLEEMMTALSKVPLQHQPGTIYRYSIGPDILLRLVEIISGQPADEYLEARLFAPLGMMETGYWLDRDKAERLAPVHWRKDGELVPLDDENGHPERGVLVQPWSVNSYTFDQAYKGGSIGLVSTATDYWRFAQAMLDGGEFNGARVLGARTIDYMARSHLTSGQMEGRGNGAISVGLGFGVIENSALAGYPLSDGSFFWSGAASTFFWIDPVEDIVVVAMTQHMRVPETRSIRGELAALIYAAITGD